MKASLRSSTLIISYTLPSLPIVSFEFGPAGSFASVNIKRVIVSYVRHVNSLSLKSQRLKAAVACEEASPRRLLLMLCLYHGFVLYANDSCSTFSVSGLCNYTSEDCQTTVWVLWH
ncbi:hypothetical protein V6N13_119996 [Hibiscus sabdariffa]